MLEGLIPILGGELSHLVLIDQVVVNFLPNETLIFLLQIFNDLVHLGHTFDVLRISEVILFLRNESHTHLVDLILLLEGTIVLGEVILDWWVELSPSKDLAHCWVKMSQVLFLSVEMVVLLELAMLLAQNLMLDLSLSGIGSTRVRGSHFLETSSGEHVLHLIGLLVSSS